MVRGICVSWGWIEIAAREKEEQQAELRQVLNLPKGRRTSLEFAASVLCR